MSVNLKIGDTYLINTEMLGIMKLTIDREDRKNYFCTKDDGTKVILPKISVLNTIPAV